MHRFVLAEFNTHRMFSRNSASSRAIPLAKQLARVRSDPALPVAFPTEQKGMQGGDDLPGDGDHRARLSWLQAAESAAYWASELGKIGVHKSIANRLLEPFLWHTVIVTATEWDNFWNLRCNPLAQPEMRAAAEAMRFAHESSVPKQLDYGQWHLPLVTGIDDDVGWIVGEEAKGLDVTEITKRVSAARCARVSYLTHDGRRDIAADLTLFDRLANPGGGSPHSSPMEHVCRPLREFFAADPPYVRVGKEPQRGNLIGWRQFRHEVEDALNDPR